MSQICPYCESRMIVENSIDIGIGSIECEWSCTRCGLHQELSNEMIYTAFQLNQESCICMYHDYEQRVVIWRIDYWDGRSSLTGRSLDIKQVIDQALNVPIDKTDSAYYSSGDYVRYTYKTGWGGGEVHTTKAKILTVTKAMAVIELTTQDGQTIQKRVRLTSLEKDRQTKE